MKTQKNSKKLKKYKWPDNLASTAKMGTLSANGVVLKILKNQCFYIRQARWSGQKWSRNIWQCVFNQWNGGSRKMGGRKTE